MAPDDIRWTIDRTEFDELIAMKKDPEHFAESRTVFIPKTSDIDDNGRIIRSPDALRPLTLCNCDCKLFSFYHLSRPPLEHHEMHTFSQRCILSRQMTDNIFEIETTDWAHVACSPQESVILLTDSAAAYPSVNHAWILSVIERTERPVCISRLLRSVNHN